jgi:hypothetical protein
MKALKPLYTKIFRGLIPVLLIFAFSVRYISAEEETLFTTMESKEEFALEVSSLLEKGLKIWQDSILINDVDVEGAQGILLPGDISEPVITSSLLMADFNREEKSQDYITCIRTALGAVSEGMRYWQRGYSNRNIPFPQGASCTYTLPPCNNVPVTVASGKSSGDRMMTESELYNYMLYRTPQEDEDTKIVFKATSKAVSECFEKWKNTCSIVGVQASGGIAPPPAPMGTGPGAVRGAKGNGGKFIGPYIDGKMMYASMTKYFKKAKE